MRPLIYASLAVLALAVSASDTLAQSPPHPLIPQAPDACCPGFYCVNYCGALYGPNYCVRPPFAPWNGAVFAPNNGYNNGQPVFPHHPFMRSPRDFFMAGHR